MRSLAQLGDRMKNNWKPQDYADFVSMGWCDYQINDAGRLEIISYPKETILTVLTGKDIYFFFARLEDIDEENQLKGGDL